MRIAVFGSTGELGRLLTQRALAAGHDVVALARDPAKLGVQHARLTTIKAELSDAAAIARALAGADAVISLLGPRNNARDLPLTHATATIVAEMERAGPRRLIVIATPSSQDPKDKFEPTLWFARSMIRTLMRGAYDDIRGIGAAVRASELDWTIVRVGVLNNKPASGVAVGYPGDKALKLAISREDIADFLLAQLSDASRLGQAPMISSR